MVREMEHPAAIPTLSILRAVAVPMEGRAVLPGLTAEVRGAPAMVFITTQNILAASGIRALLAEGEVVDRLVPDRTETTPPVAQGRRLLLVADPVVTAVQLETDRPQQRLQAVVVVEPVTRPLEFERVVMVRTEKFCSLGPIQ